MNNRLQQVLRRWAETNERLAATRNLPVAVRRDFARTAELAGDALRALSDAERRRASQTPSSETCAEE